MAQFPIHDFKVCLRCSKSNEETCYQYLLIGFPGPKLQADWFQSFSSKATKNTVVACVCIYIKYLGYLGKSSKSPCEKFWILDVRFTAVAQGCERETKVFAKGRDIPSLPTTHEGSLVRRLPMYGRMFSGSLHHPCPEQFACGSSRGE